MDTGKYHLLSTAHKTALKYDPTFSPPPRTWAEFLTDKGGFINSRRLTRSCDFDPISLPISLSLLDADESSDISE
jgi:hypothetical protein